MRGTIVIAVALAAASCASKKEAPPAPTVVPAGAFEHELTVNAAEEGTPQEPVVHVSSWRVPLVSPSGNPVVLGKGTAATVTLHNAYDEAKDISQILCIDGAHAPNPTKNPDGSKTWTVAAADRDALIEVEVGFGPYRPDGPPIATLRYRVEVRAAQ